MAVSARRTNLRDGPIRAVPGRGEEREDEPASQLRPPVRLAIGAMVLNVVVLVLPLVFLIRLSSDRSLLGLLANSRPRAVLLWVVAGGLLVLGLLGLLGLTG
jgi:Mn2+/Fe2+ NRAMP family transporter